MFRVNSRLIWSDWRQGKYVVIVRVMVKLGLG